MKSLTSSRNAINRRCFQVLIQRMSIFSILTLQFSENRKSNSLFLNKFHDFRISPRLLFLEIIARKAENFQTCRAILTNRGLTCKLNPNKLAACCSMQSPGRKDLEVPCNFDLLILANSRIIVFVNEAWFAVSFYLIWTLHSPRDMLLYLDIYSISKILG